MSKSKSKQTGVLRYSGPELGELLDQVASELGSTAAISAVNRVRSGGVAGFFCREEFEVVVDATSVGGAGRRSDIETGSPAGAAAQQAFPQPALPQPVFPQQVPTSDVVQTAVAQAVAAQAVAIAARNDAARNDAARAAAARADRADAGGSIPAVRRSAPEPSDTAGVAIAAQQAAAQLFAAAEQVETGGGGLFSDVGQPVGEPATPEPLATVASPDRDWATADQPPGDPQPGPGRAPTAAGAPPFGGPQPFPGAQPVGGDDPRPRRAAAGRATEQLAPTFPVHPGQNQPPAAGDGPSPFDPDLVDRSAEPSGDAELDGRSGTDAGFLALLERRLDEASAAEFPPPVRRRSLPSELVTDPIPDHTLGTRTVGEPIVPAPAVTAVPDHRGAGLGVLTAAPGASSGFWLRLQRAGRELSGFMPASSSLVATIGPLSLTTPVIRRLRATPSYNSAEVIVLTDRTEIVSEPQWHLVRSGHQLVDEVVRRSTGPVLLVIDVPVELPNWVAPLQNRLRMAGVGLFRYAVPGHPTTDSLDRYRLASDVPYVLDLMSRVPPTDLVEFVADRHPIASVSGADVTAELLVALREQVGLGR